LGIQNLVQQEAIPPICFWDKSNNRVTIVVATHGIVKKTQKTPKKEIAKATDLMNKYFDTKNKEI